jgi:tripeptide aminopeptidase
VLFYGLYLVIPTAWRQSIVTTPAGPDVETLLELLAIPGPPASEAPVAEYVREKLKAMGVDDSLMFVDRANQQSEYGGNTGNLLVHFGGSGEGDRILFSTHMDTVPDAVGAKPRADGTRIVNDAEGKALGVTNRAGCAVLLHLARALCDGLQTQPITMAFFIQEEVGLVGARGMDVGLLGDPRRRWVSITTAVIRTST